MISTRVKAQMRLLSGPLNRPQGAGQSGFLLGGQIDERHRSFDAIFELRKALLDVLRRQPGDSQERSAADKTRFVSQIATRRLEGMGVGIR
jgi:hypothetical protein